MLNTVSLNKLIKKQGEICAFQNEEIFIDPPVMNYKERDDEIISSMDKLDDIIESVECLEETSETSETILNSETSTEKDLINQFDLAQENLFISLGMLGYKKDNVKALSLKIEADLSIRERLKYQTEGIKETILYGVKKVLDAIEWIYRKVRKWILIILSDLTGKQLRPLAYLADKAIIEDHRVEFLKLCSDIYEEYELYQGDLEREEESEQVRSAIRKIQSTFKELVKNHGYILQGKDIQSMIRNIESFYRQRVNISLAGGITYEGMIKYLKNLSTNFDKEIIKRVHKDNRGPEDDASKIEPLIVYDHNLTKLSYCYLDSSGKLKKATGILHNGNYEKIINEVSEDFIKQSLNRPQYALDVFKYISKLLEESKKLLKKSEGISNIIHDGVVKMGKAAEKGDENSLKDLKDVGILAQISFKSVGYSYGKYVTDLTSCLSLIKLVFTTR